jgi:hypothetical protein
MVANCSGVQALLPPAIMALRRSKNARGLAWGGGTFCGAELPDARCQKGCNSDGFCSGENSMRMLPRCFCDSLAQLASIEWALKQSIAPRRKPSSGRLFAGRACRGQAQVVA